MYECWNVHCPQYAGNGVRLGSQDAYADSNGRLHCKVCRSYVRASPHTNNGNEKRVAGAAGGALLGWTVGGPAGAIIGGLVGLFLGDNAAEREGR